MSPSPVTVPSDMPVDRLVEDIIYRHHFDLIPVVDHGRLVGSAGTREIRAIPRERWPVATAGEIATPPGPHNTIEAGEEVLRALAVMQSGGSSRLMVTDGGRLVGVIVLKDLLEVLALRLDLEG